MSVCTYCYGIGCDCDAGSYYYKKKDEVEMKQKTEGLTGEDIEKIYCDVFGYISYKLSPEFKQFLIRIGVEIKKPEVTIPLTARQIEKAFDKFSSGSSYSWMDRVLKELGFE